MHAQFNNHLVFVRPTKNSTVYDKDVFSEIRSVVGGRIRMIATGSAPLSPETQDFIRAALGCYLIQVLSFKEQKTYIYYNSVDI